MGRVSHGPWGHGGPGPPSQQPGKGRQGSWTSQHGAPSEGSWHGPSEAQALSRVFLQPWRSLWLLGTVNLLSVR